MTVTFVLSSFACSKDLPFTKQEVCKLALRKNRVCSHRSCRRRITSVMPVFAVDLQQKLGLNVRSIWKSLLRQEPDSETEDIKKHKRNILVVGATGRVGRLVCKNLSSRVKYGYCIYGLSRSPTSVKDAELPKEVNVSFGDLQESKSLESFVGKVDGVIWVAGSRGPPGFGTGGPREIDHLALKNMVQLFAESWKAGQREQTIFDFSRHQSEHIFQSVQPNSIGGSSSSSFRYSTGFGIFTGNLMKSSGEDLAQIRTQLTVPLFLSDFDGLCLKVKGDGRRYRILLKDNEMDSSEEYCFQCAFDTKSGGEWQNIRLLFSDFIPVKNSSILFGEGENVYKYRLNKGSIHMIGFGVSRLDIGGTVDPNFKPGPFELAVESITAFTLTTPRLVVLSSAAVTRLEWNERQRQIYAGSFNIPIVQLNPGNILNEKRKGEDAVRSSSIPYCIIRATGLNDEHPSGKIVFQQGDTAVGRINRKDVADTLVAALDFPSSSYKTFEIFSVQGERLSWKDCFESVQLDREV
ncbi:hypothetical protein GpartN1_g1632.t1 [Galdieria partita]|uniref:NAD(P)-binding domain-containing protein n=1 Tax=Galdieria partita TaxID=83374 RepID=A0A9C7PU13_9RHOD|nr:hypothetical protein GpartN1_g1632.t1 [Galdieria partita]